jgi:hypothetical protein
MTIAVAIKTHAAVVFAVDSKLSTMGVVGLNEDGSPRWVQQTYDNATKVVHDAARSMMAVAAGHANIGQVAATDYLSRCSFGSFSDAAAQDQAIADLVGRMVEQKRAHWSKADVPAEKWPGPTLLLAAPAVDGMGGRVWRVALDGESADTREILTHPGVRLEGSYNETYGLLYGYEPVVVAGLAKELGIDRARLMEAGNSVRVLRPVDRLNFGPMPVQDAIDLAVFLAGVQIQMDRFLPGVPLCGGSIDVMVLRPGPEILVLPGKTLHHPHTAWEPAL